MRRLTSFILSTFILLFISNFTFAQDEDEEANVVGFKLLDYGDQYLPENLTSTKSVVFVSVPTVSSKSSERGDWKSFATMAHEHFREMGIDPVKYYYIDDVLAGEDVAKAVSEELKEREVENIIILSHLKLLIKNKEKERYVLLVTPFSKDEDFMKHGQGAWKEQHKDPEKMLNKLAKDISRSDQPKENLLILEKPEFFKSIDIIQGDRLEDFDPDLRIDKIAVPRFTKVDLPSNPPGGILNNQILKEIEQYNESVPQLNKELENIMSTYPFKYDFVENVEDVKGLRNQGFHFILRNLHTSGESIKRLLQYDIDESASDYVTLKQKEGGGGIIFRSIPKKAPVYKYYLKQVYTEDVVLGSQWDADETWQDALRQFIDNLKQKLEEK